MASFQRRGKNSFLLVVEAGYDQNGKRLRKTKTIRVEDEALLRTTKRLEEHVKTELYKFQAEVDAGEYINPEKLYFADFVKDWQEKHAEKNLAIKTQMNYKEKIDNYILPYFKKMKMDEIRTIHIVNFINAVSQPGAAISGKKEPLSDATIYEIDKTLRVILDKAVEWQVIKDSPMKGLKRPRVRRKRMDFYDEDDVVEFIKALYKENVTWRMFFITSAISGMRRGEVIALEWTDIDFEEGCIMLTKSIPLFVDGEPVVKSTKTDEDVRIIPMPDWYMKEMAKFKKEWEKEKELNEERWLGGDNSYVFHSGYGRPYTPNTATGVWWRLKKKHKLRDIRLHDLRHTMITFLLNEGESLFNVQDRAGHSSSKVTTDIYGHITKKSSKRVAKHFDKFDPSKIVNNPSTSEQSG